jgi:hypothetical protein
MFVLNYVTMTTSGIMYSSPPIDWAIKLMAVGGRTYKSMEKNNMVNLLPTLCIKQSSWEASSRSACQNIPRLSWKSMIHYRAHKAQQLEPILSQLNLVHT